MKKTPYIVIIVLTVLIIAEIVHFVGYEITNYYIAEIPSGNLTKNACLYIGITLLIKITAILFVLTRSKSLPIYLGLLISLFFTSWVVITFFNPNNISFNEVYPAWLTITIINLGITIWALVDTRHIPKNSNESILDDDFTIK